LLENSIATAFALGALILTFGPVSGAHFNPVVSAADWWLGHRHRTGPTARDLGAYTVAQIVGAIMGSVLAKPDVRPRPGLDVDQDPGERAPLAWRGRRDRRTLVADLGAGSRSSGCATTHL
jgi:hypothetical protein